MPRTPAPDYADKRKAILRMAAEVFDEHGYTAGTTSEIARRVGLSQPTIYHYVGSKERLLSEVVLAGADDLMSALAAAEGDDPVAALRRFVVEFTHAIVDDRATFRVYMTERRNIPAADRRKVDQLQRRFVKEIERLVAANQDAGALPPGDPALMASALLGMVASVHMWQGQRKPDASAMAEVFLALVGLGR